MDINSLQIQLRSRGGWETLDLGLAMVRSWAKPIYLCLLVIWIPFSLCLLAGCTWFFGQENMAIYLFAIWWLKPIQERIILNVLADALFSSPPSLKIVIKRLPFLIFKTGLLVDLLWDRISPARSIHLPIKQLEGQRGKARRQRRKLLLSGKRVIAVGLGLSLANAQLFLYGGLFFLISWLTPIESNKSWWRVAADSQQTVYVELFLASLFITIDALFVPFFTAGGFALYLQKRTELEAWDLQHKLAKIGQRLQKHTNTLLSILVVCICMTTSLLPKVAQADPVEDATIRQEIREILAQPEFGRYVAKSELEWRNDNEEPANIHYEHHDWLENSGKQFASGFRVFIWIIGAGFITYLVIRFFRYVNQADWRNSQSSTSNLTTLFGLDVAPENLPEDVEATALELIENNDFRAALSLLYRAALIYWLENGLLIRPGDTEGDCVRRVQKLHQAQGNYFAQLVNGWQKIAYGHQTIPKEQLISLAKAWPTHFKKSTPQ